MMTRASYPLDFLRLDAVAREPLYRQLCDQLRALILEGSLPGGARLPSIRALASKLVIGRNTVISAYDQLAAEGYLESRQGSGTRVVNLGEHLLRVAGPGQQQSPGPMPALSSRGEIMTEQPRVRSVPGKPAFHPGTPELASFPFKVWSRLLARKARFGGEDLFGYHYLTGLPDLRRIIASYITGSRRVRCTADQIVITTGGQAALDLLARLLLDEGDAVWMEDPGYLGAQSAFISAGARLIPLAVGRDGWRIATDVSPKPRLIYLTPSCQHPLGVTMPLEQRLTILEFARTERIWIIEDDFDGEYTLRGQPIPAIQGLSEDSPVIYVGSFAKTLFPSMRLGFIVLPMNLADRAKLAINFTGQFAPLILQAALADFMEQGHFFLHLNRMRRLYGPRRRYFLKLCEDYLGEWLEPLDGRAGIQITAFLKNSADDQAIAGEALRRGVNLVPLSMYFRSLPPRSGFVMGYAGTPEATMEESFRTLREVFLQYA